MGMTRHVDGHGGSLLDSLLRPRRRLLPPGFFLAHHLDVTDHARCQVVVHWLGFGDAWLRPSLDLSQLLSIEVGKDFVLGVAKVGQWLAGNKVATMFSLDPGSGCYATLCRGVTAGPHVEGLARGPGCDLGLILAELAPKPHVGMDNRTSGFDVIIRVLQGHTMITHKIGNAQ